jgi:hypothetical protein
MTPLENNTVYMTLDSRGVPGTFVGSPQIHHVELHF